MSVCIFTATDSQPWSHVGLSLSMCLSKGCSLCLAQASLQSTQPGNPPHPSIREALTSNQTRSGSLVTQCQRALYLSLWSPTIVYVYSLVSVIISCLSSPLDMNSLRARTACALFTPVPPVATVLQSAWVMVIMVAIMKIIIAKNYWMPGVLSVYT